MADVYLAIKYHDDHSNRVLVDRVRAALAREGLSMCCVAADVEEWGARAFEPDELMRRSFAAISAASVVVVELSEKGVGLGIEAGYAIARGIPVVVALRSGADLSTTMAGVATAVVVYDDALDDLARTVAPLVGHHPR